MFEANDEGHAFGDDGGKVAFVDLNEEDIFGAVIKVVDFLVVSFQKLETFLVLGFVEEVSDLFLLVQTLNFFFD